MKRLLMAAMAVMLTSAGLLAQDQTVYKADEPGIKKPVVTHQVAAKYSGDAMRRKVEGVVELAAVVKRDGTVGDVSVTRSLDPDLDQQAVDALRQWTFKPGTKDGRAVNVRVNVEMTFTLRSNK